MCPPIPSLGHQMYPATEWAKTQGWKHNNIFLVMEPAGKPVLARLSALQHAGVVPNKHTDRRQGFSGPSAGSQNPPKHSKVYRCDGRCRSDAFLHGQGRGLLRRRMKSFSSKGQRSWTRKDLCTAFTETRLAISVVL